LQSVSFHRETVGTYLEDENENVLVTVFASLPVKVWVVMPRQNQSTGGK